MTCNIEIIDTKNSRYMMYAAIMILLGVLFKLASDQGVNNPTMEPILKISGVTLYCLGWLFVAYNLQVQMPENALLFWPAILAILVATFISQVYKNLNWYFPFGLYSLGWLVLGTVISKHFQDNDKYLGPFAAVLAIAGTGLLATPYSLGGMTSYTMGWCLISLLYGYPSTSVIEGDIPECLYTLFAKYPQLASQLPEIKCVLESGCFDSLLSQPTGLTREEYIEELTSSLKCAADKCDSGLFKTYVDKLDCYIESGCLNSIIDNPPTTPSALMAALAFAFTLGPCGSSKC